MYHKVQSVLGPKRFILHINDIRNQKLLEFILLADDTNILYSDSNVRNRIIEHVVQCKQANINKLYCRRRKINCDVDITINSNQITTAPVWCPNSVIALISSSIL